MSTPSPESAGSPTLAAAAPRPAEDLRPAWRSPVAWVTLIGVFSLGIALDLASKTWAFRNVAGQPIELRHEELAGNTSFRLPWHEGMHVLPWDLLDFRLVVNHGAVFGIGQNRREFLVTFTVAAIGVACLVFARWTRARSHLAHVAIALILAGGVGNLYDRIVYGAVRDFMHMLPRWNLPFGWRWPGNATSEVFPWVFNVADVLLLTGMGLLLLYVHLRDRAEKAAKLASASGTPTSSEPSATAG